MMFTLSNSLTSRPVSLVKVHGDLNSPPTKRRPISGVYIREKTPLYNRSISTYQPKQTIYKLQIEDVRSLYKRLAVIQAQDHFKSIRLLGFQNIQTHHIQTILERASLNCS